MSEGRPRNVVLGSRQEGPHRWFSTSESTHPAPWVELHLPHNVRLLSLQHYTFTHGHHRSSYFRWALTNCIIHTPTCCLYIQSSQTILHSSKGMESSRWSLYCSVHVLPWLSKLRAWMLQLILLSRDSQAAPVVARTASGSYCCCCSWACHRLCYS